MEIMCQRLLLHSISCSMVIPPFSIVVRRLWIDHAVRLQYSCGFYSAMGDDLCVDAQWDADTPMMSCSATTLRRWGMFVRKA
jgi:hypothetical protein